MNASLLLPADPHPVSLIGPPLASGPLVFLGDHAGSLIPSSLGTLGVGEEDRRRHIALDIGVGSLGRLLAQHFGAPFVSQVYSRLVIDCNRDPADPTAMPPVTDGTMVAGNRDLSATDRADRVAGIHEPYHAAIADLLDQRIAAGLPSIVVALHSFTPMLTATGKARPWQAGVLYGGPGDDYGRRVLAQLQRVPDLTAGDNEPYAFGGTDYTVPRHCFARGLEWLELEVRQDLLADDAGVAAVAEWLAPVLQRAITG
ncbi:N-formylglutamate amidohydrolase [Croceibacterium sp. TMG7-5b_MA50]|uniref:N-formylglutamate amidohydrolase n=1 Tax=Croceibacterium sp. TMG7-5b_MA50 TaxID=3121290 RepID=UPI0032217D8A